jgi:hypothetical protein
MDSDLKKIIQSLEADNENFAIEIPRGQLIVWMRNPDIEILGVVHALLGQGSAQKCITPALEFSDYFQFCSMYLMRCMKENPHGDWSSSRYEAGWEFCRWFVALWNDNTVAKEFLSALKGDLANLYRIADAELRTALENAVLEHLFEDGNITTFFADWKHDEELVGAYNAAKLWVDRGGSSPLNNEAPIK